MNKVLKTSAYILIGTLFLFSFPGCKSQPETKPDEQPVPVEAVEAVEAEKTNEAEENAQRLIAESAQVRAEAVKHKADKLYPAQFQAADARADDAKAALDAGNFAEAQEKAQQAIFQYKTLINLTRIDALKAKINKHRLASYDRESYAKAESIPPQVHELYANDPEQAYQLSEDALAHYRTVADAGFSMLMADAKKQADEARAQCDSIKAAASMKDAYGKTSNKYRQAGIDAGNKKYEQAYTGYIESAQAFKSIFKTVTLKRQEALAAMENAKKTQEESRKIAEDADKEAPLPENAEGFSDEPIEVEPLYPSGDSGKKGKAPEKKVSASAPASGTRTTEAAGSRPARQEQPRQSGNTAKPQDRPTQSGTVPGGSVMPASPAAAPSSAGSAVEPAEGKPAGNAPAASPAESVKGENE